MAKKPIADLDRVAQFFRFCIDLETHPFIAAHGGGGSFRLDTAFPEDGDDKASVNFDEIHLESLLTRLRQFYGKNELFFVDSLRDAVTKLFGDDADLRAFCDAVLKAAHRPLPKLKVQHFKANEADAITGHSFIELMEAQLYTGAIHSERTIIPTTGSAEEALPSSHIATKKHVQVLLAFGSMPAVSNIMAFRTRVLRLARAASKTTLFPELTRFHERCAAADC